MIYNNLIYQLVVILILTTNTTPDTPQIPFGSALILFFAKGTVLWFAAHRFHTPNRITKASHYFSTEQKLSILAILSLATDIYLLDLKFFFAQIPFSASLPSITDLSGLVLFNLYLVMIWHPAEKNYRAIFGRSPGKNSFLLDNLKINLSIVLPWILLTITADLLQLAPIPALQEFLASSWGETVLILTFFLCLAVFLPVLVTRLWNCTPMPPGEFRSHLEAFCRKQQLAYADIMLWPLFEGKVLTAGIMGIVGRFRYLLITPALLKSMTIEEIEGVMAHEIGHAKRYHLQLYIFLFIGFGMLAQISLYPILYLLFNSDMFYKVVLFSGKEPASTLSLWGTLPLLVLMILYFRYVFGFFMRNFERQADIHAFEVMGSSSPLINVLEKIGWMSGDIRDVPSWHHFSIAQRVGFLEKCEKSRSYITGHHRKVYGALILFLGILVAGSFALWHMPQDILAGPSREKLTEAAILQKIKQEPKNPAWQHLLGDFQQERKLFGKAVAAYEKALELKPYQPEVMNNLAWLLLVSENPAIINPSRALKLAESASTIKPSGYVLDTLAAAFWANGYNELAVKTEKQAMTKDPRNKDYYMRQIEKFKTGTWSPEYLRDNGS
ncbi:M48 family metalloprotease [Thermodesulfobacteriota bacterium]